MIYWPVNSRVDFRKLKNREISKKDLKSLRGPCVT
jgi:hypothetical protein